MSLTSALNVAASGLNAQQQAMDVLAHNIANVNTPGYSRQTVGLSTMVPERSGGFNFGRGVQLASVARQVDLSVQKSLANSSSQKAMWTQVSQGLTSIENVFGSLSATGLAASFDHFFASWQQLANNPQDSAQKANVAISSGELVTTLTNMHNQLRTEQVNVNSQIDQKLHGANILLKQVASLNIQIVRQETGTSLTGQANDLRDKREQALQNLAALIPIQRVDNPDGSSLVQSMGGDLLVQDGVANQFMRGATFTSSGFQNIVLASAPKVAITSMTSGGSVGGMLELRDNSYNKYLTKLDSVTKNLIFGTNQIYSNGGSTLRGSVVSAAQASVTSTSTTPVSLANSGVPFASQMKAGSFKLHLYDAAGKALNAGGLSITIDPTIVLDDSVANPPGLVLGAGVATVGGTTYSGSALPTGNFAVNDTLSGTLINAISSVGSIVFPAGSLSDGTKTNAVAVTLPNDGTTTLRAAIAATVGVGGMVVVAGTTYKASHVVAFPASTGVKLGVGTVVLAGTSYLAGASLPTGNFAAGDTLSGT
ncbi:MAG: flagellar hook-associated protein FlgK, partial [Mariprofundales bacterium]|nr:flagellar hook-associated protein FlgK [Mariprofundales bacterium]